MAAGREAAKLAASPAGYAETAALADWRLAPGLVEGHPAALVHAPDGSLAYVAILTWRAGKIAAIRDFRYARYVMETLSPTAL